MIRRFAAISKVEENEDGTIQVFGIASTEGVDAQGETVTKGAMQDALPDYFTHGTGPLRAMHQPIAAGFVSKVEINAAGESEITATVVDPVEIVKVQTGVYKGFSIGGKKLPGGYDAVTKTISKMKLTEISLVDRPANPEATITMWKGEDMEPTVPASAAAAVNELAALLDSGTVTPERLVELVKAEQAADVAKGEVTGTTGALTPAPAVEPAVVVTNNTAGATIPPDEPVIAKADEGIGGAAPIKKGMWNIQQFAELLTSLGWLASDAQWEAACEGDNSTIPGALRDWLAAGAVIFQAMAAEEVAELIASLKPAAELATTADAAAIIELSDKATTLRKSLMDAAAVGLVDFLTIGKAHMGENDIAKAVVTDGFDKAADAIVAASADPVIAKLAAADGTIAKLNGELDIVKSQLAEALAKPAASNAVLRVVVAKGADVADGEPVVDTGPIKKADGSIDHEATAMQEIRKVHQSGGHSLRPIN